MSLEEQFFNGFGGHYKEDDPFLVTQIVDRNADYVNGLRSENYEEADFNLPDTSYDIIELCLLADDDEKSEIVIGDLIWRCEVGVGLAQLYSGISGSVAGLVYIRPTADNRWNTFLTTTTGLKIIKLPKNADNDQLGGDISVYYDTTAWFFAFNNTNSTIIIREDGSVYKDSVLPFNLVIDGATGEVGPAGRFIKSSDWQAGSVANELHFCKAYSEQLSSFWDLDNARGEFLDVLGTDWFGVPRALGELDFDFLRRIKIFLKTARNTPYGFEQLLNPFSSTVLIQEGLTGFGFVARSWLNYDLDGDGNYDQDTAVEQSEVVSAITTNVSTNDTFVVADGSVYNVDDEVYHDDGTSPPRMYSIASISSNNVTVKNKGWVGAVYAAGVVSISGNAAGVLIRYTSAIIKRAYIGSIAQGILRIRITLKKNSLTTDLTIAKFIYDLVENAKVPGSRVEILLI